MPRNIGPPMPTCNADLRLPKHLCAAPLLRHRQQVHGPLHSRALSDAAMAAQRAVDLLQLRHLMTGKRHLKRLGTTCR